MVEEAEEEWQQDCLRLNNCSGSGTESTSRVMALKRLKSWAPSWAPDQSQLQNIC